MWLDVRWSLGWSFLLIVLSGGVLCSADDEPVVLVRGTFTAQEQPSEARGVGRWVDKAGKDTGHVGLALSPAGAYISSPPCWFTSPPTSDRTCARRPWAKWAR